LNLFIEKGRDFNLENHLEIFDYVKACDKIKTENCLKYYKTNIFPIYYQKIKKVAVEIK